MTEPKWFHLCDESIRKAVAAELVLGGLEIAFARDFCGIRKMPMQYYLTLRKIRRPHLGVSQRRLRVDQIRRAVGLYQSGATPQEVYMLTGVALCTLNRLPYPLLPKRPGRPRSTGTVLSLEEQTEGIGTVPESEAVPVSADSAEEQKVGTPQPEISPPAPKRPGRPRKAAAESAAEPEPAPVKRRGTAGAAAVVEPVSSSAKRPGRPRKAVQESASESVSPPAKRRGRPRKAVQESASESVSPPAKRRGRPRKKS